MNYLQKNRWLKFLTIVGILTALPVQSARLSNLTALDEQYIMVHFEDGIVERVEDPANDPTAYEGHRHYCHGSQAVYFGQPLNTSAAGNTASWTITSSDHNAYSNGQSPQAVHRKTKLNGMSRDGWDGANNDWSYEHTVEHWIYLRLPEPMEQGGNYTIELDGSLNSDENSVTFTYDIFSAVSEAIHVNLVGYKATPSIKAADLYHWMGDGGARDYSDFEGNAVYIYDVDTDSYTEVGTVEFWMSSRDENHGYNFTGSDVWNIDFTGFDSPGRYRLAVEGVGASQEFTIDHNIYYEPFRVNTLGYFYMRVGQDSPDIDPRPRLPLMIPDVDGAVYRVTTMHPYHPDWGSIGGDAWDRPGGWSGYATGETNPNAWGGWADAYDWDRHGRHVGSIWDILLPFILTDGNIDDDDFGLAESGNGIPDVLDEARFEVDFFLRIRNSAGEYSHGVTNPYGNSDLTLYQAGGSAISAWFNAVNASMLAEAFRLSGHTELMEEYRDSAIVAYNFAQDFYNDQRLNTTQNIGEGNIRGGDMKMTAAAFLYNVTGDTFWEDEMNSENNVTTSTSAVARYQDGNFTQLYGIAAYLMTPHEVNYPAIQSAMREAVISEAYNFEVSQIDSRPTRRSRDGMSGYFKNIQNVQRTIVAHAVATDPAVKAELLDALILEADWGLGRNPSNFIQMTTASTPLESIRSVEAAYTSGYNDGTPGIHPGHTPYHNMDDWAAGMIMGRPSWMADQGYPAQGQWPAGELWFNTDYVWSHSEFTHQQTMRGKQALYGYLYGISRGGDVSIARESVKSSSANSIGSGYSLVASSGRISFTAPTSVEGEVSLEIMDIKGRVVYKTRGIIEKGRFSISHPQNLAKGFFVVRAKTDVVTVHRSFVF